MAIISPASDSIFILNKDQSQIMYEYIDLSFFDSKMYRNYLFDCLNCCKDSSEHILTFSPDDMFIKDKITEWVYEMSMSYIRQSGIDCAKLHLHSIECIRASDDILLKNKKDVTVIFHFNGKLSGYVTTHKNKLDFSGTDKKYIVSVFERN
jgi:hypothetical protein